MRGEGLEPTILASLAMIIVLMAKYVIRFLAMGGR